VSRVEELEGKKRKPQLRTSSDIAKLGSPGASKMKGRRKGSTETLRKELGWARWD